MVKIADYQHMGLLRMQVQNQWGASFTIIEISQVKNQWKAGPVAMEPLFLKRS